VAQALEARGTGSFAPRRAQYLCELALAARAQGAQEQAAQLLAQAQSLAPGHARARVLAGQWALAAGDAGASLQAFEGLLLVNPGAFNLIASDYAKAAEAAGQSERALQQLADRHVAAPSLALLTAMQLLDAGGHGARLQTYVQQHPSLNAARSLLQPLLNQHAPDAAPALLRAIDNAAKPLLRHRCAACGFEATHYFWQCPGCLSWDSFPPRPVEEL
jgi:lipopolysaccharide biosynthesis regulator YciM